jgi:tRNA dimethylallyltransferase
MASKSQLSPLLVIVGETASGKTALSLELAEQFNGEIICADSWTVRKHVDIGTAKPTAEERARVPHHLLDVVEPDEDFTAAVFKRLANEAIADIAGRGKLPIMVGGTGLYVDGVIYDFDFLPAGDRQEREELNRLSIAKLLERIEYSKLDLGDIDTRNKRRLIRLIETKGKKPTRQPLRENTLIIGLKTDREIIEQRIISRLDDMLAAGLEDEVRNLADKYGWPAEALKGIGYAQWRDYFEGTQSLPETRSKIIKATFEYAKRQRTWFKRNKSIHWFHTPVNHREIVDTATTFLND